MNLYYELIQLPVFSLDDVKKFYSNEKTARVALERLLRNKIALKIRNGLYTCVSGESGGPVANRYQIASAITSSSYVSHHTAFEYYGIADQVFYEVYVGSKTRFHDFVFDGYTYHYVSCRIPDGITSPLCAGGIKVTDKERTIVDSVKDMNRITGFEETITCIDAIRNIDEGKLLKYLKSYNMPSLYQKVGFIFSAYQADWGISDEFLHRCEENIGNSKRYLTNTTIHPVYSSKWHLVYPENFKYIKNGDENATV